ncbi:MAG TPA: HAD hydrolase-like protein [Candidatus Lokiarchaeia archaeon]|nr:HAD hydrolase-like protein [Candidatus Lokiarchaeia archaeon]
MVIEFSNVKFVIFDFDGVLFNGLEAIKLGTKDAIEKYGLNVDFSQAVDEIAALIQKLMAIPIPKIILQSFQLLKELSFLNEKSYFKKLQVGLSIYQQYLKEVEELGLYDGIPEMLSILESKGIKFAILTSGMKASVLEKLKKFGVEQYFPEDLIIGAGEVTAGHVKPDPEGIEIIVQRAGIDSLLDDGGVIFIGDMHTDIQAGKNAFDGKGVKTVGVISGYDSKLAESNPDLLLETTTQLLGYFR